ncbi:vq domain-containing protein [Abeliophyllum distichum]|uniref:Vq domain-containing protein n=1 Tax=Abeliophyllum distichum TaxID=126358 RepID=A0ABD1RTW4_9LAMI
MKPPSFDTFLTPSKLTVHKDSHAITKLKPKIRIIHIVAPEIIKTDVENFRELVQRLTGKPAEEVEGSIKKENNIESKSFSSCCSKPKKKMELAGIPTQKILKASDEEMFEEDNPNGFLRFISDLDYFFNIQETSEFSIPQFKSSQINMFGEILHLC